jgi:tetratricopeptide (TPR) repeat protein
LLVALVLTVAAYVLDQLTEMAKQEATTKRASKLRRLVEHQSTFLAETTAGFQAQTNNQLPEAVIHFRRALVADDSSEGHLNLGRALFLQGKSELAFEQFKTALQMNSNTPAVYTEWGQDLTRHGKLDEAVRLYEDALRHNSNFARVHYYLARIRQQQEQTALAAADADQRSRQPEAAARDEAEARLYASDAVKHYIEAERAGLQTPDFWRDYGALLNREGQFEQAEQRLRKAVAAQPNSAAAEYQLGLAEDNQGKYVDAVNHYEAALKNAPNDPATLNSLALLYATATNQAARSPRMAVQLATRACDATSSQNPRYLDTLARAYAADTNFVQAIAWEDKAVRRATQLADHDLVREFTPRFNLFLQHKTE